MINHSSRKVVLLLVLVSLLFTCTSAQTPEDTKEEKQDVKKEAEDI